MPQKTYDKFVFSTRDTIRYRLPTHSAHLVMDRADADTSEAFLVVLEPGESPPLHVHHDTEQVFYVIGGRGELHTRRTSEQCSPVGPGDLIRIPAGTHHRIACTGAEALSYLSVDCFLGGRPSAEPTWEDHLRVVCQENGWDFAGLREDKGGGG